MRSVLRTALQLLRAESSAERERIVEQIGSEHPAVAMFNAIADAARNPDLPAPEVFDAEYFPGPNDVADYFDNPSNVSRSARLYEDACAKSDLLLAEIAACDEILNVRLQRPIRAAKNCRARLYAILRDQNDPQYGPRSGERTEQRAKERTTAAPRRPEPVRETMTREERRPSNGTAPSEFDWSAERSDADFQQKRGEEESYPFFSADFSPDGLEQDLRFCDKAQNPETRTNDDPDDNPPAEKKKRGWLESLFLTFLLFGLILWLVPIAKNRLLPDPSADTEPPLAAELTEKTPSSDAPLPQASPVETPKLAATPELLPFPNGSKNDSRGIFGQIGQETKKVPSSEENGTWKPLTLNQSNETNRPAPERNHRAVLNIPERNNNVFGK